MPLIYLHVNYVEQGQTLEEVFSKAVDWGFDGIELRRKRSQDANPEEYLDACARASSRTGMKHLVFGGGPNLVLEDAAARKTEIEEFIRFYELALQRFSLELANVQCGALLNPDKSIPYWEYTRQGSYIADESHWRQAVEGMGELGAFAERHGLRLAIETHMSFLHDRPDVTLDLVRRINRPAVGVNLDCGNLLALPDIPPLAALIPSVLPHLFYVHLKNAVEVPGGHFRSFLEEGQINHREYLRLLRAHDYRGPLCLEAPRAGDREWFARRDMKYLKSLLLDLNWK
jgi:sugar phosphate isomerase/epimerase